jgi:hypothetical protein
MFIRVCCAFSLRRESPDMILGDKPFIFEVVLSQHWTSYLRQPGVGYVMSSIVHMYGYRRRPMSSCMVLDPLGAQAVHRPRHLSGHGGEDVLGESTTYIFQF